MIEIKLPFWLSGEQLTRLTRAARRYWERVEHWLRWPLRQIDAETCALGVLDLLAWQRNITRFTGEPEHLYRLRVKYAYANAVDAGSVAGVKRIFQRLGVGYLEVEERTPGRDWDVITLRVTDGQLAQNAKLLSIIIGKYGRTCRRYQFEVITPLTAGVALTEFNNTWTTDVATL
ncbi:probable phage protein [Hahella chejuensis KCTC 2396]|uniref:Probable phage protein n=1 Tax=Hahella chejuensis (strain KCTC 2396) TaxID=349521 RepID=Q2S7G9_HAHCH|nr:phage tail protein [Hahella chejuensis]ABC33405.1 probable phage protein [Hahella chejuensis KCTC 2396]